MSGIGKILGYPSFHELRREHLEEQCKIHGTPTAQELKAKVEAAGAPFGPINSTTSILIQPQPYVAEDGTRRYCWRVFNVSKGDACDDRDFDTVTFLPIKEADPLDPDGDAPLWGA